MQTMRDRARKLGGELTTRRTERGRTEVAVTTLGTGARIA
jgi:nitrate/nitrite-specific signal transduction histidine kinase